MKDECFQQRYIDKSIVSFTNGSYDNTDPILLEGELWSFHEHDGFDKQIKCICGISVDGVIVEIRGNYDALDLAKMALYSLFHDYNIKFFPSNSSFIELGFDMKKDGFGNSYIDLDIQVIMESLGIKLNIFDDDDNNDYDN